MMSSLPDAIERIRQGLNTDWKHVLGAISTDLISMGDTAILNKKIHENIFSIYELKGYDKEIIYQGLTSLGKGDVESQIGIITNSVNVLSNQLNEATEERMKNQKLYRTLGTAIGLMIAIIFI
ncbi:MAG: stage III sporulation protein AB [Clostridia bacterium]|nr:stage III sporulation protein AB [Clostridia bacterium]MDD4375866.1 stage III sporulation protein AB [Clostridia bacterium]